MPAICRVPASRVSISAGMAGVVAAAGFVFTLEARQPPSRPLRGELPRTSLSSTSIACPCHDEDHKKGELALDTIAAQDVAPASGRVGESRPEAPRASDAAGRQRAAGRRDLRRGDRVPGDVARSRRRGASESGPDGDDPPAHANRIPERHPRSARARDRRRCSLLPGRRIQLRLRQRDGRRSLADAAGPLHLGGGEDQPRGDRAAQPFARRRHHQGSDRISRRRSTSTACRSARAAARSSTTRSRWTASTRSRFA